MRNKIKKGKIMVAENNPQMTIKEALQAVIEHCPNPYAKQYAQAVPRSYSEYGHHGVKVQVIYVLSNILDVDKEEDADWYWKDCELKNQVVKVLKNYKEGDFKP
jgi:hypothetical protein